MLWDCHLPVSNNGPLIAWTLRNPEQDSRPDERSDEKGGGGVAEREEEEETSTLHIENTYVHVLHLGIVDTVPLSPLHFTRGVTRRTSLEEETALETRTLERPSAAAS